MPNAAFDLKILRFQGGIVPEDPIPFSGDDYSG